MKIINIIFALVLFSSLAARAQNKIVVSYDDNGNRILRERICPSCRPAPPDNGSADSDRPGALAEQIRSEQFSVYPNPSDNKFNIRLDAELLKENCDLVLTDLLGREVLRQKITSAATTISTNQMADGTYYVIITSGTKKRTVKLVKESSY